MRPMPKGCLLPWKTDINGIVAKTGYWRVPDNPTVFVKCLNPCACLGARNTDITGDVLTKRSAQQHCPKVAIPRKAIVTDQDYVQTA